MRNDTFSNIVSLVLIRSDGGVARATTPLNSPGISLSGCGVISPSSPHCEQYS